MQHSHFVGRKYKSTRYLAYNGLCLCATCHAEVEDDPGLHSRLFRQYYGERTELKLTILKHKPFKMNWKQYEKDAAAFYRQEFKKMCDLRLEGKIGRIDFTSFRSPI